MKMCLNEIEILGHVTSMSLSQEKCDIDVTKRSPQRRGPGLRSEDPETQTPHPSIFPNREAASIDTITDAESPQILEVHMVIQDQVAQK